MRSRSAHSASTNNRISVEIFNDLTGQSAQSPQLTRDRDEILRVLWLHLRNTFPTLSLYTRDVSSGDLSGPGLMLIEAAARVIFGKTDKPSRNVIT